MSGLRTAVRRLGPARCSLPARLPLRSSDPEICARADCPSASGVRRGELYYSGPVPGSPPRQGQEAGAAPAQCSVLAPTTRFQIRPGPAPAGATISSLPRRERVAQGLDHCPEAEYITPPPSTPHNPHTHLMFAFPTVPGPT